MANRTRLIALLALALFVRALVPTGWMPVATAGGVRLQLCPGQAMPPVAGMHHGHQGKHERGDKQALPDHPCAFAGLGLTADAAPPPLPAAIAPVPATAPPRHRFAVAVGRGLAAPPPPATGPPAFA